MKLLLKQVIIADRLSPYNGLTKDILVLNGKIASISDACSDADAQVIDKEGTIVTPGWVDVFSHFCDPGYEHRETLETGAAAAASAGFTTVFVVPNTTPAIAGKAQVEYIKRGSATLPVYIMPLGAVTKNAEGGELAEMYDMLNSGAVAFTDGLTPIQSPGLLLKALQYIKAFNGVIVQMPVDKSISKLGLMNEGIVSTRLGLAGIPSIAEELMIARDIELLKYTGSRLHVTGVSTAKGIELISRAKTEGLKITCSITPYHLFFCDEDLQDYDTNLKVDPPLRSRNDMMALRKAVEDGLVDCIASHHRPQDWDNKVCEFEYAKPGMAGMESAFKAFNTLFPSIGAEKVADLFSNNARQVFNLAPATITEDANAEITMFSANTQKDAYNAALQKSKCKNNAFAGQLLSGQVIGTICKDQLYLNE